MRIPIIIATNRNVMKRVRTKDTFYYLFSANTIGEGLDTVDTILKMHFYMSPN